MTTTSVSVGGLISWVGLVVPHLVRPGSGKSTLFRLLLGVLRPTSGRLVLDGVDTAELSAQSLARLVAYVPQSEQVSFDFTAFEVALMGRTPHLDRFTQRPGRADYAAAEHALASLGIAHLADTECGR